MLFLPILVCFIYSLFTVITVVLLILDLRDEPHPCKIVAYRISVWIVLTLAVIVYTKTVVKPSSKPEQRSGEAVELYHKPKGEAS